MATSTELLRAAEHMQLLADDQRSRNLVNLPRTIMDVVGYMRDEAKRLQAAEARQPKRSWPEGWPPFAVLRRAYESLGVPARPSTKWLESHGYGDEKTIARAVRREWTEILRFSDPSSP